MCSLSPTSVTGVFVCDSVEVDEAVDDVDAIEVMLLLRLMPSL